MSGDPTGRISHTHEFHRGFSWKPAARVATTANITLSGTQTIDGVAVVAEDIVLVKNQTTGSQNGLYWCKSGAWVRHASMDQDGTTAVPAEEVMGAFIYVIAGTTNGGTLWRNTNTTAPTLGTTALTFTTYTPTPGALDDLTDVQTTGETSGVLLAFNGTVWRPAYTPEPLLLEDGTIAVLENGHAAMSEPTYI